MKNSDIPRVFARLWLSSVLALSCQIGAGLFASAETEVNKATPSGKTAEASGKIQTAPADEAHHAALVHWQDWSAQIFDRAKRENRMVILDLEAIWCHWCHVMDEKTYSDPVIAKLINDKYLAVKVDQDSRPDLSNRYQDYGWPATVFFAPDGHEVEIRSGFIQPKEMLQLLETLPSRKGKGTNIEKQSAVKFTSETALTPALRKELFAKHVAGYDTAGGGWGFEQKFLDWDTVEYAMLLAGQGDQASLKRAKDTLRLQRKLIDPAWGGVYQYSTHGDWNHPHFEKIMQMQAENMRIYALAYCLWHDAEDLGSARLIARYLHDFLLSPDGAFYTSQDADLVQGVHSGDYFALNSDERKSKGIPRIDKHIYSRENGWAINALVSLYMACGDAAYLDEAKKAAQWIITNRSLPNGGFRHDENDKAGPYLGDTLAMGQAFLNLYAATADRAWLKKAEEAANFIALHFEDKSKTAGFATADVTGKTLQVPQPLLDENVMMARFTNLLFRYSGNKSYQAMARRAMRFLATPEIARQRRYLVAGILLADREQGSEPGHITVIGPKEDPSTKALLTAALSYPSTYKRIEVWDRKEGPLPNPDVDYPEMKKPAAFTCVEGRCSAPVYDAQSVKALIERLLKK